MATGFLLSGLSLPFIKLRMSIGTTVNATIAEPIMQNVFVRTRGENNFFSCPVNKRIGAKEIRVMSIEKKTARPTVREEFSIIPILSSSESSLLFPMRVFSMFNIPSYLRQCEALYLSIACKYFRPLLYLHPPNRLLQVQFLPKT